MRRCEAFLASSKFCRLPGNKPAEGTGALLRGLAKNKSIRTLDVSKCTFDESPDFEIALKRNRSLRRVT